MQILRARTRSLVGVLILLAAHGARAGDVSLGERIYKTQCASCHGKSGEGTLEEYPHPLAGEKSLGQLTRLIAKTMPADDPGACKGPDAEAVAAFIHETFYSKTARVKFAPVRLELSRLTVRQYRNTLTDLVGGFRAAPAPWGEKRGLKAEYFNARDFRGDKRLIDRIDPTVQFNFGTKGPDDKFEPHTFSIRWEGSILALESGEYEFIVKTEHAVRLFVNDPAQPLIDAWVKSGKDTEFRGSIVLLGGRTYPLRLEFTKSKQGVDDSKTNKKKPPEVPASIALEWKPPQRVAEVIPARVLSPAFAPPRFVVKTPFPPDDRSVGYERGTSISKAWDQATTDAAIETAEVVADHLRELSGVGDSAPDRDQKLREFAARFVTRAFRRPLTDDERKDHVDRQFEQAKDSRTAVKRVVLLALKSPRFLYREVVGGRDPYSVASRLSFTLWDSFPDQALLDAAAANKLGKREEVVSQAERMLTDPRTKSKTREFLLQWLKVEQVPDLSKDPAKYADFTPMLAADLRTSLDLFLDDAVWGESSDFRQLLLSDFTYLNGRLARFYGADLPADSDFRKVPLDSQERSGVLGHPYLLSTFAYTTASSPIHRGVFLARSVLGRSLRPPPVAFAPLAPDLHPDLTTRERVSLQTSPDACVTCHALINPLGFALEHFDAAGRYRKDEKGRAVDSSGTYQTRSGETITFGGGRELATFLAGSDEVHAAFIEQFFHYLVKQPILGFGPETPSALRKTFETQQFHLRKLIVDVAAAAALPPRRGP